ncbi:MAG: helix-turn-helix transcriptional regulator [Eubacteriales bacterium]|nr:helix-turn-helix transcriptional regulator [Eubacteriales bacterium]
MSLSDNIHLIRQKALMNQKDFADQLHVSLASVNRWEVGKSIPNISAMKSIKAFCKDNNLSYELIETEWLSARLEAKK